jgi:hypothetical protein
MSLDPLSATFAALADPTRRAILARLALGETSVTELAEPFEMSWRPCRIEPEALKGVDDWLERYRRLWEERLDRLEAYLHELQAKDRPQAKDRVHAKERRRGRKK